MPTRTATCAAAFIAGLRPPRRFRSDRPKCASDSRQQRRRPKNSTVGAPAPAVFFSGEGSGAGEDSFGGRPRALSEGGGFPCRLRRVRGARQQNAGAYRGRWRVVAARLCRHAGAGCDSVNGPARPGLCCQGVYSRSTLSCPARRDASPAMRETIIALGPLRVAGVRAGSAPAPVGVSEL